MVGHQVKDCQSSLSNFKNRKQKHIQETPHTLCGTHTLCREPRLSFIKLFFFFFFKGAVCPGRCEFDERFRKVEGRLYRRLDRLIENWMGMTEQHQPTLAIPVMMPSSEALHLCWIQWCCSVEDYFNWAACRRVTGCVYILVWVFHFLTFISHCDSFHIFGIHAINLSICDRKFKIWMICSDPIIPVVTLYSCENLVTVS